MQSSELTSPLGMAIPFALNGDKNFPEETATGTDTSSLNLGFLPITQQPLADGGIAPERIDFNGMFYLSTDLRVFLQNGGVITYNPDVVNKIGGYPQNAILGYIDNTGRFGVVRSLIDDNAYNFVENPNYINGQYWEWVNLKNFDLLSAQFNALQNSINTLNSQVVKTSGNQTASGNKTWTGANTFTGTTKVPASTTDGTALQNTKIVKGGNGYCKLGNGLIIQWGASSTHQSDGRYTVVSYPIAFSSDSSYRVISNALSAYMSNDRSSWIYSKTRSGCVIANAATGLTHLWIAIGS